MLTTLLLALAPSLAAAPQTTSSPAATTPAATTPSTGAAQQAAAAPQAPAPQLASPYVPPAIEAPTQPSRASSSSWTRTDRPVRVATGPVRLGLSSPVRSLTAVRGDEDNTITGVGLVTGLAGTGDSIEAARQLLQNLLLTRDIKLDLQTLASKNVAVVLVEGELRAGVEPGRRIDVRVSTIGDASSLEGGVLAQTELTDLTGTVVYATASGALSVGGFLAEGRNASAQKNHPTVGTIPAGGKVEREVPTSIVSEHGYLYLDLQPGQDTVGNAVRVADAVNDLYPSLADVSPDGRSVRVRVPTDVPPTQHAAFLDSIQRLEVPTDDPARVVVNGRTGVIVMGGDVRLRAGAIAHGSITVTIAETPEVSQPGPLSGGQTQTVDRTSLAVTEEDAPLVLVPGAVTLSEVVEVLNVLGTTPRELMSILEAMAQGGLLVAEIRRL